MQNNNTTSAISAIRNGGLWVRSLSAAIILAFGGLVTSPAVAATRAEVERQERTALPEQGEAARLNQVLLETREHLRALAGKPDALGRVAAKEERSARRESLKALRAELRALDKSARADFRAIEKHLKEKNLSEVILERHYAAVAKYEAEADALLDDLTAIETADEAKAAERAAKAFERLEKQQLQRSHKPFDPEKMPFGTPDNKAREPAMSAEEFSAAGISPQPSYLAANAAMTSAIGFTADDPLNPLYLSATPDAQITPAIQQLAEELEHSPVKIHNWVRNNIEYLPTYGSIQGSQLTLDNRKGNAFDTASLLVALLRASNIPSRYVYGTVEIPSEQVMNWVGGVSDPMAAGNLLGQGGIPHTALVSGGQVKAFRLEHVWVEAWVDFYPSRGAVNRVGDTWTPMDVSFKQYEYTDGMEFNAEVPFDSESFLTDVAARSEINESEGWVRNVDSAVVDTRIEEHKLALSEFVDQHKDDATVADVFGDKLIVTDGSPILAGAVPYKVVSAQSPMAELPTSTRHYVSIEFYSSLRDQSGGLYEFRKRLALPELAGKRIALVYKAATEADQSIIDRALEEYRTTFPAYLVQMYPQLKIDNEVVANGPSVTPGVEQAMVVHIEGPTRSSPRSYPLVAGDLSVIGLNAASVSPAVWEARTTAEDLTDGQHPGFTEEMFHQVMLGYWAQVLAFNEIAGWIEEVVNYQLPSHGVAGAPLTVEYAFGVARSATYKSRILDVKENRLIASHKNNRQNDTTAYVRKVGILHSYLESSIYEQMFLMQPGYSLSAVTAINQAANEGQRIWTIDESNLEVAMSQLALSEMVQEDIRNGVAAGLIATVHEVNVANESFRGAGYILVDPVTGSGAYRISGGRDGNDSVAPASVVPVPELPANASTGLILGQALRNAGASLVVKEGVVTGIAVGGELGATGAAGASLLGPIIALMAMVLVVASQRAQAIEKEYPRDNRVFRHYTTGLSLPLILGTNMILASADGTFGKGVYGEEPADFTIGCPMTATEVAEIMRKYEIEGQQRDSYVDVVLTRKFYWDRLLGKHVNSSGTVETVMRLPFLYFGPFSIAVDYHGSCPY